MKNKIIRNFLAKQAAGRSDDGIMITLRDPQKIELLENIMTDLLLRNGIDPRAITSEQQLKNIINQIEAASKQTTQSGIRNAESAKVFEIATGKEIPKGSKIMGGQAVDDMPPPGSRGGPDDIAAPVQSSEESLKNMIEAENKKGIAKIKQRQKMLDDAIDNVSPSLTGDRKYDADIVAADLAERMGLVYDDLPTKQRLDLYDKAYTGLSKRRQMQRESLEDFVDDAGGVDENDPRGIDDFIPDPEDMAKGGRVGLKGGADAATASFSKSAGSSRKGRSDPKGGFNLSGGQGPTFGGAPPTTGGGGGGDNNQPPQTKQTLTTTQTKDSTKKNILKNVGGFAFNRFLNSMGIPTKDIQKALAIKGILEQAGDVIFPEGNLQNIKATAPDQKTYNIEATKDMVENLPGGVVKDIFAPAGALVMSPFYDTFQGIQRGLADPSKSVLQAIKDENILSSALERFTGAAAPLAERFEKGGIARIGLKDGMNRRTFLKLFTGLVSLPIIGKVLKPLKVGKTVSKVPIIKTGDVPGKPEWFDQLVNKVILEGDDVSKRFATQERQVIHKKKIDDETSVTVTQDLNDGSIFVDIDDPIRNVMGESGDDTSVMMMLKKNPGDESSPAGPDEFSFTEADMRNYMDGPDDYTTEFTENTVRKMKDLTSDLGKIKSYATGKKPTMKEFIESKKRQDKVRFAEEKPAEYAAERGPDIDYSDYDDGMASGGIARMLGE